MECTRCLITDDLSEIVNGTCEFCKMHDRLEKNNPGDFKKILNKIRKQKGYQVLIGISGGLDSTYLLYYAVNVLNLKVLAIHFDNGWNTQVAEENMKKAIKETGVDLIRLYKDDYYDDLCEAFRESGTPDVDIPNDMYMADMMQTIARKYGIKYILNGHDYRTEGTTPLKWTYMDARYMCDVYYKYWGYPLRSEHIQTFWKQILASLYGIKHIRPFHYIDISENQRKEVFKKWGIIHYGPKHGENSYTKWVGYKLLPEKFGIDKRIVYLSAQIRSGLITKEKAKRELKKSVIVPKMFKVNDKIVPRENYKKYNFKRYKLLIYLMYKLNLTSYNFYKKYTK